jgi:hypothetical protein
MARSDGSYLWLAVIGVTTGIIAVPAALLIDGANLLEALYVGILGGLFCGVVAAAAWWSISR